VSVCTDGTRAVICPAAIWPRRTRWTVAGTGPDSRYLLASRGGVTLSAWTPEDLAAEIRRETGAR